MPSLLATSGIEAPAASSKRGYLSPLEKSVWRDEGRCNEATQGAGESERPPQEDRRRSSCGHRHPKGGEPGKLLEAVMNLLRNGLLMRKTGDRRRTELTETFAFLC